MKNILIIGYPKSGTTWLSRLVGEVLQAPVRGYWNASHADPATEGLNRKSEYSCYKSHISYENLQKQKGVYKIVYIYRDPRDIAVSGAHFFKKPISKKLRLPLINNIYRFYETKILLPSMKQKMSKDIVRGNTRFAKALGVPWSQHIHPYIGDKDIFKISYEKLRSQPLETIQKITNFLGFDVDPDHMTKAIESQSLKTVKSKSLADGDGIVRDGSIGSWRTELPERAKEYLTTSLEKELESLGYSRD